MSIIETGANLKADPRFTEFCQSIKPFNIYSQFGEDGIIKALFERIKTENEWCLEVGAADGLFFSNTRDLIKRGWSSVQIEANPAKFERLAHYYCNPNPPEGRRVQCYNHTLRADGSGGLEWIMKDAAVPIDIDLLVLDIDGQEYHIWNQMLTYRPRVIICEFDPNADQDFVPEIDGPGQAGERAIHHVALARGYQVICKTWCNLICVRNDLVHLLENQASEPVPVQNGHGQIWPGSPETPSEPAVVPNDFSPTQSAQSLFFGFTDEQLREAKEERAAKGHYMFAACMSTPRFGPLSTMDVIQSALAPWGTPFFRGEGGYWHHQLTDSIERALKLRFEFIITFDYDSLFSTHPQSSDIAKLLVLMVANPDVDIIAPLQMKREGGNLLASTEADVNINQDLIQVWLAHFGMTIFRTSLFEKLDKPWFYELPDENGSWHEGRTDADIGFWKNCKKNNVKLCLATDIVLGHGEYNITFPDDNFKPLTVPLNEWRKHGQVPPVTAFDRQRFVQSVLNGKAAAARTLDMGASDFGN